MTSKSARNPQEEIAAANPWYVEDQFSVQLGSPAYRAVVQGRWRVFETAIVEWVRARGDVASPLRLLDAGCGDGINLSFLSRMIAERGWQASLVGADYSTLRVGRAQGLGVSGLVQTSVTKLGLANASVDIVLCNQVLEHVPDESSALLELRRVLRPGGLLIVGVPNEGSGLGLLRNHVLQRSILGSTDHVNMYTPRKLRERLTTAGFSVLRIEPQGLFLPHTAVHGWLNRWHVARQSFDAIGRAFPSCAAGLFAVATRPR